ncbi:MAG: hypothetical protein JXA22_00680 [Candidatus Thermoplasmatota archaeon]|nr:hypothetical protein [Candidatus Thermoplasmatota archaeon]
MKFDRRDIILVSAAVLLLVITIVLGYFVFKVEEKKESDLIVEDVQFIMRGADSERSRIEIAVFISNVGNKDVGNLKIRAFTVETGSNLAMDDSSTTLTDVRQQTTVEGDLMVDIPNNDSYRMELLIFREDRLVIRGSGTIDLENVGAPNDYRNYPAYDDDDVSPDDAFGASEGEVTGLLGIACVFFLIVCVIVGLIIYASVRSQNAKKVDLRTGGMEGEGGPGPDVDEKTDRPRSERGPDEPHPSWKERQERSEDVPTEKENDREDGQER